MCATTIKNYIFAILGVTASRDKKFFFFVHVTMGLDHKTVCAISGTLCKPPDECSWSDIMDSRRFYRLQKPLQRTTGANIPSRSSKAFHEVDCPKIVQIYNKNMGGVNLLDSLLGLYRINVRSKKWYFHVLTHMLDLSVVAAWLLYRKAQSQLGESEGLPLAEFKAEIAECLTSCNKSVAAKRPGRQPFQSINVQLQAKKAHGSMAAVPPKDVRADQVGHWPKLRQKEAPQASTLRKEIFCALQQMRSPPMLEFR